MPQVDIRLIHQACQDYLNDPLLKPFARVDLTEDQTEIDRILGKKPLKKIIPEVSVVAQKKKIAQDILQANSVTQVADILDRIEHEGISNRAFLQKINSPYLTWLFLRTQLAFWWQELKTSRYWSLLWLAVPITSVAVNAGLLYYLGIFMAVSLTYFLLRAVYTLFQTYRASIAFEERSQQLMTVLDCSIPKEYNPGALTEFLRQVSIEYDQEGKWIDVIIEHEATLRNKRFADGSPVLYALLTAQNPNYSYSLIKKLQQAISLFIDQKYIRNAGNETPMQVLNRSDMYGFKYLLETLDPTLFQTQFTQIDRFLESKRTQRRNTKALLLLAGTSGTGKSQATICSLFG